MAKTTPRDPARAEPAAWGEYLDTLREQIREAPSPDFETRQELAEVLLAAGRREDGCEALLALADEAVAAGMRMRAVAILRRMDTVWPDSDEVTVRLAALARRGAPSTANAPLPASAAGRQVVADTFSTQPLRLSVDLPALDAALPQLQALLEEEVLDDEPAPQVDLWERLDLTGTARDSAGVPASDLLDLVVETLRRLPPPARHAPAQEAADVLSGPLFASLSDEDMNAILRRLRVADYDPGDILVTEGEASRSLFVLSRGQAKVFVRSPTGRDVLVAFLEEGEFFGELATISGQRRSASVTAATRCEVLELAKDDVDELARTHPRVRDMLDDTFVERASSRGANVARALDLTAQGHVQSDVQRALARRFGRGRWDARVRARLARALIDAGHEEEALPILAELAGALLRSRRSEKAQVVLDRIQRVLSRDIEELPLAPLAQAPANPAGKPVASASGPSSALVDFHRWLVRTARERAGSADASQEGDVTRVLEGYGPGLQASPLFEGLDQRELADLLRGLRVLRAEPGDVILTEGEQGESLFALLSGAVKVWARDEEGRNRRVCRLEEGAFFGEVATLSGRPRCASVTVAEPCVLLEMRRGDVATVRARYPRIGNVLDTYLAQRSSRA
jgi:CRP-like cAMP-binding protein